MFDWRIDLGNVMAIATVVVTAVAQWRVALAHLAELREAFLEHVRHDEERFEAHDARIRGTETEVARLGALTGRGAK